MSSSDSGSESDSSSKIDSTPAPSSNKSSKKTTAGAASKVSSKTAKGKGKSRATMSDDDEDEDEEQSEEEQEDDEVRIARESKFRPADGMRPLKVEYASTPFDYDTFAANPNLELWAVRIPENIKPKHLAGLSVSVGAEPSGSLKVKSADYSLKTSKTSEAAEELASLHPMLPRKSKNGYLIAPRPISNHLILAPVPLKSAAPSTSTSSSTATTSTRYVPPVKPPRLQPVDKLKFRNKPFGYGEPDLAAEAERAAAFAKEKIAIAEQGEVQGGMDHAIDGAKSKAKARADGGGEKEKKSKGTKRKSMADGGEVGTPAEGEKKKKKSKKSA